MLQEARFIQPFSARTLGVFKAMAKFPKFDTAIPRAASLSNSESIDEKYGDRLWQMSSCWNETTDQKKGIIERKTGIPRRRAIPSFRAHSSMLEIQYTKPQDASAIRIRLMTLGDLRQVPDDYVPRSNYGPAVEEQEYLGLLPRCRCI